MEISESIKEEINYKFINMLSLKDFNSVEIKGTKNFIGGETGKYTTLDGVAEGDFKGDEGGWYIKKGDSYIKGNLG